MLDVLLMLDEGCEHQERKNAVEIRSILMAGFGLKES